MNRKTTKAKSNTKPTRKPGEARSGKAPPTEVWVIDTFELVSPQVTRYRIRKQSPTGVTVDARGAIKYIPAKAGRTFCYEEAEAKKAVLRIMRDMITEIEVSLDDLKDAVDLINGEGSWQGEPEFVYKDER